MTNFNKMLHCYAAGEFATVAETQDLERLSRPDFHMFIMSKKQLSEERNQKLKDQNK